MWSGQPQVLPGAELDWAFSLYILSRPINYLLIGVSYKTIQNMCRFRVFGDLIVYKNNRLLKTVDKLCFSFIFGAEKKFLK